MESPATDDIMTIQKNASVFVAIVQIVITSTVSFVASTMRPGTLLPTTEAALIANNGEKAVLSGMATTFIA